MNQRRLLEGLQILKDYAGDDDVAAEHDIIYFGTIEDPTEVNPEDVKKLDDLGFFYDDDLKCWCCYT